MKKELEFAKALALKAGNVIHSNFEGNYSSELKPDKTVVTEVDISINQMVINAIEKAFPGHSVYGEELKVNNTSKFTWVCDPIDGTKMFTLGIPISMFSLALVEDGVPQLGVAYDPFRKRLYHAAVGGGAYVNDEKIHVSSKKLDHNAVIDVEWWPGAEYDVKAAGYELAEETEAIPVTLYGAVQGCGRVAVGAFEAALFAGTKGNAVDIAAMKVIVEEAGGKVTDVFGNDQRYDGDLKGAVISNGIVHQQIIDKLNE